MRIKRWGLTILEALNNEEYDSKIYLRQRFFSIHLLFLLGTLYECLLYDLPYENKKNFITYHLMFYQPALVITWARHGGLVHNITLGTRNEVNETKAMAQAAVLFFQNAIQWFSAKFIWPCSTTGKTFQKYLFLPNFETRITLKKKKKSHKLWMSRAYYAITKSFWILSDVCE